MIPKQSKQVELTWKFTKITRLPGKSNPTMFIDNWHWMKEKQAPKVAAIKMHFDELKSNPVY